MEGLEEPRVIETEALPMAKLYAKIPTGEIGQQMGKLLHELTEEVVRQGIAITGPWFTHHFRPPDAFFDFEVCLPVAAAIVPAGRVEPGVWAAMRVVRAVYTGPYTGLVAAWGGLMAWCDTQGIATTSEAWERYLVHPAMEQDAAKWRTELNRPLAS